MSQGFATQFYKSTAWKKNRANYMKRPIETAKGIVPPGMCERCFMRGELVPAKVVHHRIHLTPNNVSDPHVTLAYDNLQRLCQDCHAIVHSGQGESRVTFDEHGNPVKNEFAETFEAQVSRLMESVDDRRNIHSSRRGK